MGNYNRGYSCTASGRGSARTAVMYRRIRETTSSKSMAEKARALGEEISAEDGLGTAIKLIVTFADERRNLY